MNWFKKHGTTVILVVVFIVGVSLLLYPSLSDYWNSFHQTQAIMSYAKKVANMDVEKYTEILDAAKAYNKEIAQSGIKWTLTEEEKEVYESQLNIDETGNMGYIDIPKINITLPIYHGTSETVLQTSIGHLEGTSLPVGGEGSHCVLSGHRGLPSAKLFSDLDKLVEGDTFSLTIMDATLTYEVDQVRIVEPTDLSELRMEDGKDYCTLVTCTPYGINTHRLLVRGHRVDNPDGEVNVIADALQIEPIYIAPLMAAPILIILLILMLVTTRKTAGRKKIKTNKMNAKKPNTKKTANKKFIQCGRKK